MENRVRWRARSPARWRAPAPSLFLHPAEGVHGDLGMVTMGDVVIALSNSGETDELTAILPAIARINVPIIASPVTLNPSTPLP